MSARECCPYCENADELQVIARELLASAEWSEGEAERVGRLIVKFRDLHAPGVWQDLEREHRARAARLRELAAGVLRRPLASVVSTNSGERWTDAEAARWCAALNQGGDVYGRCFVVHVLDE